MSDKFNQNEIVEHLKEYLRCNEDSNHIQTIHTRSGNRGGLVRFQLSQKKTLIIKLWRIRNKKEKIKSSLHFSNGYREWSIHNYLYKKGILVPDPIVFLKFADHTQTEWEAMVIEDLGESIGGLDYLKKLVIEERAVEIEEFEKSIIAFTRKILKLGLLDIDHQLNNFIITNNFELYRIDFECARRYRITFKRYQIKAEMFSRLIASHVYAVQPHIYVTEKFIDKLYGSLKLSIRIRRSIKELVNEKLLSQYESCGVKSEINLPV